jgi:hypothetical protein
MDHPVCLQVMEVLVPGMGALEVPEVMAVPLKETVLEEQGFLRMGVLTATEPVLTMIGLLSGVNVLRAAIGVDMLE